MNEAERAALVERIATIISGAPFPSKRSLANADAILAIVRDEVARVIEPGEGTIGGYSLDYVKGRVDERVRINAALTAALQDSAQEGVG